MNSILAGSVLTIEMILAILLLGNIAPVILIVGAWIGMAGFQIQRAKWRIPLFALAVVIIGGAAAAVAMTLPGGASVPFAIVAQAVQVWCLGAAPRRTAEEVSLGRREKGRPTWLFVIAAVFNAYVAFARHDLVPTLTGMLAGTAILLLCPILLDLGLSRSPGKHPGEKHSWNAQGMPASVLLAAGIALTVASLLTPPLIGSIDITKELLTPA